VWLGRGDGTLIDRIDVESAVRAGTLAVADLNADGIADLVTSSQDQDLVVVVLLGQGDGTFGAPVSYSGHGGAPLAIADFDRDGLLDILEPGGNMNLFRGRGDGTFLAAVSYAAAGSPVLAADFNGDARPDLLLANSTGEAIVNTTTPSVQVLLNSPDACK
jgi:hypothetical protein